MMACEFLLPVAGLNYHPGGTALRIETFSPTDRCSLRPKTDNADRTISVIRWMGSGGSAIGCAEACHGPKSPLCPTNVAA